MTDAEFSVGCLCHCIDLRTAAAALGKVTKIVPFERASLKQRLAFRDSCLAQPQLYRDSTDLIVHVQIGKATLLFARASQGGWCSFNHAWADYMLKPIN